MYINFHHTILTNQNPRIRSIELLMKSPANSTNQKPAFIHQPIKNVLPPPHPREHAETHQKVQQKVRQTSSRTHPLGRIGSVDIWLGACI